MLDFYFDGPYCGECIYLFMNEEDIEGKFMHIVERGREEGPVFWDKDSLEMMKDYDDAIRVGNYGILTPEGKKCINVLSVECQAALIVMHAAKYYRDFPLHLDMELIDIDTWIWISEHYDLKILIPESLFAKGTYFCCALWCGDKSVEQNHRNLRKRTSH